MNRAVLFGLLVVLLANACKSSEPAAGAPPPAPDAAGSTPAPQAGGFAVTTSRYDNLRTGANTQETVLTTRNVAPDGFGLLFSRQYDGNPYAQPLYVAGLTIGGAKRNVVFIATSTNHLYAFDADDPGAMMPLWSRWLAPTGEVQIGGKNPNTLLGQTWCRDLYPFVGITGTPVIDLPSQRMYLVTKEGHIGDVYRNKLHALDITTGEEAPGSPVPMEASVDGTGEGVQSGKIVLDGWKHLNRAGLLLANKTLYVPVGSHCDDDPYHGWVLAYDPVTLKLKSAFNTAPNGSQGAIWQSGVGLSANANGVYFSVGNGTWSADGKSLGLSVVRLNADNTLADWFTPSNADALNVKDADLMAGALLVPGSKVLFSGGKEGILYVIDQLNMTHFNADGDKILQRVNVADPGDTLSAHIHTIGYWNQRVYVWPENHGLKVYSLVNDHLDETPVARFDGIKTPHPGGILTLSANGTMPGSGIVWATLGTAGDAWHNVAVGVLAAIDATTGVKLWDSAMNPADTLGNFAKWSPPIVANGKVYVTTFAKVNASSPAFLRVYGLKK